MDESSPILVSCTHAPSQLGVDVARVKREAANVLCAEVLLQGYGVEDVGELAVGMGRGRGSARMQGRDG